MRAGLRNAIVWATRGQLLNVAAAIHEQPTPFPSRGPGRGLEVRHDDTFIVSYPRSGNTWLRFLVANLIYSDIEADYSNIESLVPDIYVTSEVSLRAMQRPRVLKSHEAFDPRYRKVIYAVRDPRDVVASQYTTLRRLRRDLIDDSFSSFVDRQISGEFDAWFGSWSANVNSWIHHASADLELVVVRYEDIRQDPTVIAAKIASFLGVNRGDDDLRRAVANSSRRRMQELYKQSSAGLEAAVGNATAGHLQPSVESDRPMVTADIDARIRARYGATMAVFGY